MNDPSCSSGSAVNKLSARVIDMQKLPGASASHSLSDGQGQPLTGSFITSSSQAPLANGLEFISREVGDSSRHQNLVQEFSTNLNSVQPGTGSRSPFISEPILRHPNLNRNMPVYRDRMVERLTQVSTTNQDMLDKNSVETWNEEFNKLSLQLDHDKTVNIDATTDREAMSESANHLMSVMNSSGSEKLKESQFFKFLQELSVPAKIHKQGTDETEKVQVCSHLGSKKVSMKLLEQC